MSGDESVHSLVMPFVVVRSKDGPYDDDAFVAGYECGRIDALLERVIPNELQVTVHTENVPQLDLIAMRRRYSLTAEPWEEAPDAWVMATFRRVSLDAF